MTGTANSGIDLTAPARRRSTSGDGGGGDCPQGCEAHTGPAPVRDVRITHGPLPDGAARPRTSVVTPFEPASAA